MTEVLAPDLPNLEADAPDWVLGLLLDLPDSFRAVQPIALKRDTNARRLAEAVEAASHAHTDWELARRRLLARILADGDYAGTQYLRVDFWRRRKVLQTVGGIATALYEGRGDDLRHLARDLLAIEIDGLPDATVSVMLAAREAALDLPVRDAVIGVVRASRQHCEDTRGPGAAVSVERLAATWATDVIIDCIEQAHRPNAAADQRT